MKVANPSYTVVVHRSRGALEIMISFRASIMEFATDASIERNGWTMFLLKSIVMEWALENYTRLQADDSAATSSEQEDVSRGRS